jgi:hypothetical protein
LRRIRSDAITRTTQAIIVPFAYTKITCGERTFLDGSKVLCGAYVCEREIRGEGDKGVECGITGVDGWRKVVARG